MATTDSSKLPGAPVEPNQAQGAQIPLSTFTIPSFPPSARGLKALTLTSAIPVDAYQTTLAQPFTVPSLPSSIESLTLELFSLGYPPGFLAGLATALPNLKSVVIYSQLFPGLTDESQRDAVQFFKLLPNLRALHLLDVFARPGFFAEVAQWVRYNTSEVPGEARRGLMFLEVNYTFRHEDEEFMAKIQVTELPALIGPGLISCSFNMAEAEEQEAGKEGLMAFNQSLAEGLVAALVGEETYPRGLRALNSTLFTFSPAQLDKILATNKNVMVLQVTADVEPGDGYKKGLLKSLEGLKHLEQVEIVANPSMQLFMELQDPSSRVMEKTFPSREDMDALSKSCEKLSSFKATILRARTFGFVGWEKRDGGWRAAPS